MKLYRQTDCPRCNAGGCGHCNDSGLAFVPVDPADLDKMNLDAVMVLGEFRKDMERDKENTPEFIRRTGKAISYTPSTILKSLDYMESAADLGEIKKKQIALTAWGLMLTEAIKMDRKHLVDIMDGFYVQAELEEGKTNDE